jgi:adhesin transport system membrane fusion protein
MAGIIRLQAEVKGAQTVEFPKDIMEKAPQSVAEELRAFSANRDKLTGQTMVLEQQLAQRRQEINELSQRASDLKGVIALQQQRKDMVEPLIARGSAPKIESVQIEQEIREKSTELNGALEAIPRGKSAISEAQARITELKNTAIAQAQMELAAKTAEMNTVKQTLGALEDRKDRTEIVSPVRGIVKDFKINTVGGIVRPGDPILEVVPIGEQLVVEAKIKPQDIARLRPGLPAMVKFTAYDFSIYGGLKGEVTDISADTIKNEKGESFYRVRIQTKETELKRKGEVLPIIPGMVTTVDILTGQRTVMQYILKPIGKTLEYSLHEK